MTDVTVTTEAPQPQRDQTGTLVDQSANTTHSTSEDSASVSTKKPDTTLGAETADGAKPEATKPDDAAAKPEGAPETYADFTAPEGYEIDKEALAPMLTVFKDLNLTQDSAQKLLTEYWKMEQSRADASAQSVLDLRAEWRGQVQKDFGSGLEAAKTTISRAIDTYLDPADATAFREAMNFTGAGDHPAFLKAFHKLAQLVGEGTHVRGGNPSPHGNPKSQPKSAAQIMYPNLPSAG